MSIAKGFSLQKSFLFPHVILNCRSWLLGNSNSQNINQNLYKVIHFHSNMDPRVFEPPGNLHGMKVLDKEAFKKSVVLLSLETDVHNITKLQKQLKKYLLRFWRIKCIEDTAKENVKRLLFDPTLVKKLSDFDAQTQRLFKKLDLNEDRFSNVTIDIGYDNFSPSETLKAVLPVDEPPLTSFSIIGHIVHVNLKPHLSEYKNIIGQILLDKVSNIKTVVNKTNRIDNVYRNFEMELICGEPDYIVTVRENGTQFKFDFSKVYWNPRLGTEHSRVIDTLNMRDVLIDVFCGVGPFSIPAAKKKCTVYANDLNPESIRWLQENIKINKIPDDYVQTFNKDASDFICNDVKEKLIEIWKDILFAHKIVIVMNLPALALEFLKCFKGLVKSQVSDLDVEFVKKHLPIVHCYFFAPNCENPDDLNGVISESCDIDFNKTEYNIHFVRNVATTTNMYKVQFVLPYEYLISEANADDKTSESSLEEPRAKKFCKEQLKENT